MSVSFYLHVLVLSPVSVTLYVLPVLEGPGLGSTSPFFQVYNFPPEILRKSHPGESTASEGCWHEGVKHRLQSQGSRTLHSHSITQQSLVARIKHLWPEATRHADVTHIFPVPTEATSQMEEIILFSGLCFLQLRVGSSILTQWRLSRVLYVKLLCIVRTPS